MYQVLRAVLMTYVIRVTTLSPPVTCTLVPGQWVLIKNVYFRARGGGCTGRIWRFSRPEKTVADFFMKIG